MNRDESLLIQMDLGIHQYLDNPIPDLFSAHHSELDDPESPTLWETYNAATRNLNHCTSGIPDYKSDQVFQAAGTLLENENNQLPDPAEVGGEAVRRRANDLMDISYEDQFLDGEPDAVRELLEVHAAA